MDLVLQWFLNQAFYLYLSSAVTMILLLLKSYLEIVFLSGFI